MTTTTNGHERTGRAVPARYTCERLYSTVTTLRAAGVSLRGIARGLNQAAGAGQVTITHRVVQRIAEGIEPQRADIRAALGLPVLLPAAACFVCGVVHTRQCRVQEKWVRQAADWLASRQVSP